MSRPEPKNPTTIAELGGHTKKIRRLVTKEDQNWSTFNPSIAYDTDEGYLCLIRSGNYFYNNLGHISLTTENVVRNKLYLARLDSELSVTSLAQVKYLDGPKQRRGNEDARLFFRDGNWFFHTVMKEEHCPYPRICLYQIDIPSATAIFIKKYDANKNYQSVEKNWMLPSKTENKNFEFIYDQQKVLTKDEEIIQISDNFEYKDLRGGSNLLEQEDGSYISVCHYSYHKIVQGYIPERFGVARISQRKYTHVFTRYDQYGKLIESSDEFVFDKFQIEFACGLENYGDQFVVSYGVKDLTANLGFIDKSTVYKMLRPLTI